MIDVAETGVVIVEKLQSFVGVPRGVANFDDERIVGETLEYGGEPGDGLFCAMERERKLEKDGSEFAGGAQNVEASANSALVGSGRGESSRSGSVCKAFPEFGGEDKARIGGDAVEPLRGVLGTQRLIEGSVDLDGVEEFGEISSFVEIFRTAGWIDVAGPVWIGPTGGADTKSGGGGRIVRGFPGVCARRIL